MVDPWCKQAVCHVNGYRVSKTDVVGMVWCVKGWFAAAAAGGGNGGAGDVLCLG